MRSVAEKSNLSSNWIQNQSSTEVTFLIDVQFTLSGIMQMNFLTPSTDD